jgi:hypothetical protein
MGMPFLLRGRKGIFAGIMGVVGVRATVTSCCFRKATSTLSKTRLVLS